MQHPNARKQKPSLAQRFNSLPRQNERGRYARKRALYGCYPREGVRDAEALNLETVAKAHEGGLICYAACMGEGKDLDALLALGVDAILTGDCHRAVALVEQKKKHPMG